MVNAGWREEATEAEEIGGSMFLCLWLVRVHVMGSLCLRAAIPLAGVPRPTFHLTLYLPRLVGTYVLVFTRY